MADRPILFSAPMVRAILAGTKTQTRRIIKPQPTKSGTCQLGGGTIDLAEWEIRTRRKTGIKFSIGDRLWVREAHYLTDDDESEYAIYIADGEDAVTEHLQQVADLERKIPYIDWSRHKRQRPSIHMPRWASRITLTVTDVRVERLQDISDNDAFEEGVINFPPGTEHWAVQMGPNDFGIVQPSPREAYAFLWDRINGKGAWDKNPWVAAYTFKATFANIDILAGGITHG